MHRTPYGLKQIAADAKQIAPVGLSGYHLEADRLQPETLEDPTQPACEVQQPMPFSTTTRWTVESAALKSFIDAPANAGLGMGIRFFPDANDACNAAVYQTPARPIAALPGAASQLDSTIDAQTPGGQTPTVPSIQGALSYAQGYATANATHHVSVVYSTYGYPMGSLRASPACAKTTIRRSPTRAGATPTPPTATTAPRRGASRAPGSTAPTSASAWV